MRPPQPAVLRKFWLSVRRGAPTEDAAAALGYTKRTGTRWFGQAGGVVPAYVTAQRGRRNLSFDEREEIFAGVERGDSIRLIARSLGGAPYGPFRLLLGPWVRNAAPPQVWSKQAVRVQRQEA